VQELPRRRQLLRLREKRHQVGFSLT
jgi:hypothetical protein